jgi:hypothetical protein
LGIAVAAGVAQLISWRQVAAAVSILVITLSAALSIFFLHRQQVVHIWPESYEAIEPVVAYWHEQRRVQEPTYVYYGAVPAFSYYCLLYDLAVPSPYAREMPPPSTSIYYGRWFRSWSTVEKVESIWHTMKGSPKRFWLVFSHIYPGEDQEILEALQDSYSIRDSIKNRGTSLFLLERQ